MYVANLDENYINSENALSSKLKDFADKKNVPIVNISAKIEEELSTIKDKREKKYLMESLHIKFSGLEKFISLGFGLLNLITFFTSGEKETKAWTILKDTTAPKAAGKIHSDIERGFISAEVIDYKSLLSMGGDKNAKISGKIRTEGKEYIIKDGDVILFRFNV